MTGSTAVQDETTETSRRVERKQRREGPAPEDALAQVREGLGKATATANAAIKDRNDMAATALATTEARINEREQALTSQIAATKTAMDAARAAKKAAREAGNGEAEDEAAEALMEAMTNLKVLEIQKANFDADKPRALESAKQAAKPVEPVEDNSASTAWIASRPRFNKDKDPDYFETAVDAHKAAVADGIRPNTAAYFAKIDKALERTYGPDHANAETGGKTVTRQPRTERTSETSMAAPVGREGGGEYSSRNHNLRISVNGEGKRVLHGDVPQDWVEAAKWSKMSPVAYAMAQLDIEAEGANGNGGFDPQGRVQVYR